jgi:ribonuclease-3
METNYINNGIKIINNLGEEEIIQIPYNINNVFITENDLIRILDNYNVKVDKINNMEIIKQAFTHKSYCKKNFFTDEILKDAKKELNNPLELIELRDESYETLETLGDSVLKLIITFYLFERYRYQNEGFITRLKTKLEDKTNLALMSKEIGLGKYFIISKHIELTNGRNLERLHEDIFEAFIGALFKSNGFMPVVLLVINLLETLIDYSQKLYCDNNYKDTLLRYHHSKEWTHPKYDIIYYEGPAHKRKYLIGLYKHNYNTENNNINKKDKYIGYGIANSHKLGEQYASKMALIIYGVLKDDQYTQSDLYYPEWDKIEKGLNNILDNINNDDNINNITNIDNNTDNNSINNTDNISIYSDKSVEI